MQRTLVLALSVGLALGSSVQAESLKADGGQQWYKGQTHTHSLWSDGDGAPEVPVAWYKDKGYDFLAMSDHNILMRGEKWEPIKEDGRLTQARVDELREQFGEDWAVTREQDGAQEMKLKTFEELEERFEEPGEFILIEGEEITARVHVNGLNLREEIPPVKGDENLPVMREQIQAVQQQSHEHGVPMLAHTNHPNFSQGITAEELAAVTEGRFFEVFNGHGSVRNWGDESLHMPSTDGLWDIALALRLSKNPDDILYGVATDDTHNYFEKNTASPGRGFCMVLSDALEEDAIIQAMLDGKFYASSGVLLDEITSSDEELRVVPKEEDGVTYRTIFYGTRKGVDLEPEHVHDADGNQLDNVTQQYGDAVGEVLLETTDVPAVYTFDGDEMYVRATVISDKPMANPFKKGDTEMAWTQPVVLR